MNRTVLLTVFLGAYAGLFFMLGLLLADVISPPYILQERCDGPQLITQAANAPE